jgi:hypothetical protein
VGLILGNKKTSGDNKLGEYGVGDLILEYFVLKKNCFIDTAV